MKMREKIDALVLREEDGRDERQRSQYSLALVERLVAGEAGEAVEAEQRVAEGEHDVAERPGVPVHARLAREEHGARQGYDCGCCQLLYTTSML